MATAGSISGSDRGHVLGDLMGQPVFRRRAGVADVSSAVTQHLVQYLVATELDGSTD